MPLFFGYTNAPLLKSKAEEAAGKVIDHLKLYGLKKAYVLKPDLDTYYKYNNSWKSNFCFLYKKCNYSPSVLLDVLMDNTKTQYRKGLLSKIQKTMKKNRSIDLLSGYDEKEVPKYKGKGLSKNDREVLTDDKNRCGGLGQKLAWLAICNVADEITGGYLQGDYNLIYTLWSEGLITFQKGGYYKNIAVQMTEFHTGVDHINELTSKLKAVPNVYDIIYEMFRNANEINARNSMADSYNSLAEERLEQRKDTHPIGWGGDELGMHESTIINKFITAWHFSAIKMNYICKQFMKLKKGGFADFLVNILETVKNTTLHKNHNLQNKNKQTDLTFHMNNH